MTRAPRGLGSQPGHVRRNGRDVRLLLGAFWISGALLATNLGEFWPFSIYPMFSKAGGEWTRAVVLEIPGSGGQKIEDKIGRGTDGAPIGMKAGITLFADGSAVARHGEDAREGDKEWAGRGLPDAVWSPKPFRHPHLQAVPTQDHGVDPIDLANYMSKTREWDARRADAVRTMFEKGPSPGSAWMVHRVRGRLAASSDLRAHASERVELRLEPVVLILPDTVYLNPDL